MGTVFPVSFFVLTWAVLGLAIPTPGGVGGFHKWIAQIKNLLRGQGRFRDLLLFVVGVNTALRISDVLRLRIGDFLDEKWVSVGQGQ